MQHAKLKLSISAAAAAAMSIGIMALPAQADYAPVAKDVVGVGSDTVQYASDFIADGDYTSDLGYNDAGNKYKIVNFDATPDANARLAYGPGGALGLPGSSSTDIICGPGTGATAGTGNETSTGTAGVGQTGLSQSGGRTANHDETTPCILNPTIVLRAGQSPVTRPNGSSDGAAAIATDTHHYISYTRASAPKASTLMSGNQGSFDRIQLGTDDLKMLAATTTNAVPLSENQLNAIYKCNTDGSSLTWSQVGTGSANPSASIVPYIPQAGSGTRTTFLGDIGSPTLGACVQTSEENDPTILNGNPNAIEPVSSGRVNMFLGITPAYSAGGTNFAQTQQSGYFKDPSCKLNIIAAGTTTGCTQSTDTLAPAVTYLSGTPSATLDNSGSLGTGLYDDNRGLFIYIRDSDVTSSVAWQPGGTLNWARTLFYNPCPDPTPTGTDGCTTDPNTGTVYGPGGAPYYATAPAYALIAAAGITPEYLVVHNAAAGQ